MFTTNSIAIAIARRGRGRVVLPQRWPATQVSASPDRCLSAKTCRGVTFGMAGWT
jgi:hypothetical protein